MKGMGSHSNHCGDVIGVISPTSNIALHARVHWYWVVSVFSHECKLSAYNYCYTLMKDDYQLHQPQAGPTHLLDVGAGFKCPANTQYTLYILI